MHVSHMNTEHLLFVKMVSVGVSESVVASLLVLLPNHSKASTAPTNSCLLYTQLTLLFFTTLADFSEESDSTRFAIDM